MAPYEIVPSDLLALTSARESDVARMLEYGRAFWSDAYIAHVESGLARLRSARESLEALREDDQQAIAEERERGDLADEERRKRRGDTPWSTSY